MAGALPTVLAVACLASVVLLPGVRGASSLVGGASPFRTSVPVPMCDGILADCKCNVDDVERANSQHLGTIIHELVDTTFFRLMKVNLDKGCEIEGLIPKKKKKTTTTGNAGNAGNAKDTQKAARGEGGAAGEEGSSCSGGVLEGATKEAPKVAACSLSKEPSGMGGAFPFMAKPGGDKPAGGRFGRGGPSGISGSPLGMSSASAPADTTISSTEAAYLDHPPRAQVSGGSDEEEGRGGKRWRDGEKSGVPL
jgi:hypothetical protein